MCSSQLRSHLLIASIRKLKFPKPLKLKLIPVFFNKSSLNIITGLTEEHTLQFTFVLLPTNCFKTPVTSACNFNASLQRVR
jgi:hypothetical protein